MTRCRQFADNEVLQGFESGLLFIVGPQTDASAAHLACCYDDVALPIVDIWHGWAKSQPVRDECGYLLTTGGFVWHAERPRGGWPCTMVTLASGAPLDLPRYTRCAHAREGGHRPHWYARLGGDLHAVSR